jgi:hypothetical protein
MIDKDLINRSEFGFIKSLGNKYTKKKVGHFHVHGKHVYYAERSLYLLSVQNPLRRGLVWLIKWK